MTICKGALKTWAVSDIHSWSENGQYGIRKSSTSGGFSSQLCDRVILIFMVGDGYQRGCNPPISGLHSSNLKVADWTHTPLQQEAARRPQRTRLSNESLQAKQGSKADRNRLQHIVKSGSQPARCNTESQHGMD